MQRGTDAEMVLLSTGGCGVGIHADRDTTLLVLTGMPIDEPVVGQGPFVMNTREEIRAGDDDYKYGRFGKLAA